MRFSKDLLRENGWKTYPTLKVVNACDRTDLSLDYLKKELMLYRMYEAVSGHSYRTVELEVAYVDEGGKRSSTTHGFLIEHEEQLASRIGGSVHKSSRFSKKALDRQSHISMAMFQYMIGNADWKLFNQHNLTIIRSEEAKTFYAVPYDFDYAGMVNAHYAVPNEKLPLKSITERIYLGPCQTEDELNATRQHYQNIKSELFATVDNAGLKASAHSFCRRYLSEFYDILEREASARRVFTNCIDY